jgi:hypothetical protein
LRGPRWRAIGALSLWAAACEGQRPSVLPDEPFQVVGGQFFAGALPGTPPWVSLDGGQQDPAELSHRTIITTGETISAPTLPLLPGAAGEAFSGFATTDTAAIGVAVKDMGTGYWVVPAGGPVAMHPGVQWGFQANFNPDDPPGPHILRFVAIDGSGSAGRQIEATVCIDSTVPDNRQACLPGQVPPAAVISLRWDDNFDLDLHVVTPDGTDINPRHSVVPSDAGVPPRGSPATLCSSSSMTISHACIDRDSLANCVPDGLRQEDVILTDSPAPGPYRIYVDPFAPCGQAAVRFTVTVYALAGTCPSCGLVRTFTQSGELLSFQVTGGAMAGLFIQQIELPQGR